MILYIFNLTTDVRLVILLLRSQFVFPRQGIVKGGYSMENQLSITAIMTAYMRAFHAAHGNPRIFNDFLAYEFIPEENRKLIEAGFAQALHTDLPAMSEFTPQQAAAVNNMMQFMGAGNVLSRSEYTEERLEGGLAQGVKQYIILGAGLDTFVYRRHDLVENLQVFEIDHPLTQDFKQQRISQLGWEMHRNLHMVPVDFNRDSLIASLQKASYKTDDLSFFSWLGVTVYLPRERINETLGAIAGVARPGSSIVFDYMDIAAFNREQAAENVQVSMQTVKEVGEPMLTGFDPEALAEELYNLGWNLRENLDPGEIEHRYFQGRNDGWHASNHSHLALATVR